MADSTSLTRDNSKAAIFERLKNADLTPSHKKEEVTELPRWVKTALVLKAVDGLSWDEAAKKVGKAGSTLSKYGISPAAHKWLASLYDFLDDPVSMAKAYLSANALSITLERFAFLEAAVSAGDYKEGDKIARDLQDRMGVGVKKQETGGINIKVVLGGGSATLEGPVVEGSYTIDGEDEDDQT